jgi:protein-disulfide isomerase
MTEYLDFECPFCAKAEPVLRRILDTYSGEVALIAKHFPLTEVHEWAQVAALAAEAAAHQGKFWQLHDLLFKHQQDLDLEMIFMLAARAGLELEKFASDLRSKPVRERVERDLREGTELGVDGTPTLFINGALFEGEITFNNLSRAVAGVLGAKAA